jgi:hypothetical protein
MYIPDPDLGIYPSRILDPGSGSVPLDFDFIIEDLNADNFKAAKCSAVLFV